MMSDDMAQMTSQMEAQVVAIEVGMAKMHSASWKGKEQKTMTND